MSDRIFQESFESFPVAMAYVPWQKFSKVYENLEEALEIGTIFPELHKPFTGGRGCCI